MERAGSGRAAAVTVLLLASFMDLMDSTIVNLALPTIETSLRASAEQLEPGLFRATC